MLDLVNQSEIHRMVQSEDIEERGKATKLFTYFAHLVDKQQAWVDLHRLTLDENMVVRQYAAGALGMAFPHIPDKIQAWNDLHRLMIDEDVTTRQRAVGVLGIAFRHVPDKQKRSGWDDLRRLMLDENIDTRRRAVRAFDSAFCHIPDKKQAWDMLVGLAHEKDEDIRWKATRMLGSAYRCVSKKEAWEDLHKLIQDDNIIIRRGVTFSIGTAFLYIPNKEQAIDDLYRLTTDEDEEVRSYAYHSLGRALIFKATKSETEEDFENELERAIQFFEKSSKEAINCNPSKFCLPFYKAYYIITFNKIEAETEVQKYLDEARNAAKGTKARKRLLKVVENIANALKEAKAGKKGLDSMKNDLNIYREYCENAVFLLGTTWRPFPDATKLIWKGLPIVDKRIKEIISDIQQKATAFCKQTLDTPFEDLGKEVKQISKDLLKIRDPKGLEKSINNMQTALSAICAKMPEEDRGDACELLKKANQERYIEDKLDLINMVLSKIPSQIGDMAKKVIVNQYGSQNRYYSDSDDKSINIIGDITVDLENLKALIERDYQKYDKQELLQAVHEMKGFCNDPTKKNWLRQKFGWLLSRTSEVASISSFAMAILQSIK